MSGFKSHILGNFLIDILVVTGLFYLSDLFNLVFLKNYIYDPEKMITLISISFIFSIFPDIDTNSHAQKIFYFIFLLVYLYFFFKGEYKTVAILGLFGFLPVLSKHRSWTHSKMAAILICSLFLFLPYLFPNISKADSICYFIASLVGYFNHLIIDGIFFR